MFKGSFALEIAKVMLLKKTLKFGRSFITIFLENGLTRASAALSYYLTLTLFPLIICLYTLLGNSYDKAMGVLDFAENLMAAETVAYLKEFLAYVAANNSAAMMMAGIAVLITSASAAVRSLQVTIGEMQGEQRYEGLMSFLFSIAFSLLFVAALYLAILLMMMGGAFIDKVNSLLPFIDISKSWTYLRFLLMAGIVFIIVLGVYEVCLPRHHSYSTWPGALFAMFAMVGVSAAFSVFISASVKYSLVYGSLAAIILLMVWLHTCCQVIYCGAAINIMIRDNRKNRLA